jgi:hypothetical protein
MNKKLFLFSTILIFATFASVVAADTLTKCDFENGGATDLHPNYMLCSTHVYNAGNDANFEDVNDRAIMDEVVALKATIIAQEMKRQYDFLDATVRRLRTQLEKATLVAKMEAAGAESSESSSSSGSSKTGLGNAEDCGQVFSKKDRAACLQRNYQKIYAATSSGSKNPDTATRTQIANDATAIHGVAIAGGNIKMDTDCMDKTKVNKKCITELQKQIGNLSSDVEREERDMLYRR